MIPYNPPTVKNVTERPENMILNIVAGSEGHGSLYEDNEDNADYAAKYAVTEFSHTVNGMTETYTIAARLGITEGLPSARRWTLRIYNATLPESVKVNGTALANGKWSYDESSKCLTVELPKKDCSEAVTTEVCYSGKTGVTNVNARQTTISYDKGSKTLSADFGENKKSVSLSICNPAGMEQINRSYSNISGFKEDLTTLNPSLYICRVEADKDVTVSKIYK